VILDCIALLEVQSQQQSSRARPCRACEAKSGETRATPDSPRRKQQLQPPRQGTAAQPTFIIQNVSNPFSEVAEQYFQEKRFLNARKSLRFCPLSFWSALVRAPVRETAKVHIMYFMFVDVALSVSQASRLFVFLLFFFLLF